MTENPFQLPGYQVIGMQDTGVAFDVHLQPPSPVACSSCGTIGDFVKNGTRDIRVMDLPVHGKPVTLWIARQRFQCKSCGSTFRPELPGIHPDAKMTERLHQYIEREAFNGTHKALARILHEPQKNRPASRSVFLVNGCVTAKKNGHPCYNFVCSKNNNKNDHVLLFYPN